MNTEFENITGNIFRLKIPFEDLYTSVFIILSGKKTVLFDSGTNEYDVKTYILPALGKSGFIPDFIVLSHHHGDHSGGIPHLTEAFPQAKAGAFGNLIANTHRGLEYYRFSDGETVCGDIEILNLKGHTDDCAALFDKSTKTLLSGDCFQLCGISRFGCAVCNGREYLKSVDRILESDTENIIASHEYVPFGSVACGRKNTVKYLEYCRNYFEQIGSFISAHKDKTCEEIAEIYNKNSCLPPVPHGTFENFPAT